MKSVNNRLNSSQQRKNNSQAGSPTMSSLKHSLSAKSTIQQMIFSNKRMPALNNFVAQQTPIIQPLKSHSHKNSQVDLSNLTKLIKQQKNDISTMSSTQNLGSLIAKAKEITSSFKNSHFFGPNTGVHQRNESNTNVQISQKKKTQEHKSFNSNRSPSQHNIPFLNYQNLKDLMNKKQEQNQSNKESTISKNLFNFQYVIGIGGFGKVWKVDHKRTGQIFAMKEMSKALVITKKSVNSVMNERNLLSQLKQQLIRLFYQQIRYIVNMHYAYQDRENLYLLMDYMPGGDLRFHIGRMRRFNEEQTKFFVACIFSGLEFLHNNNIIHRDIKPENLVLDEKGYARITDLGIARIMKHENSNDTSGTPGYMAPEVMCRQNHSFAVDYYALGVIAYEFMLGRRPYLGRSRQEIRDQILAKQVQIKKQEIPEGWSLEAADIINRLIQRKPQNRLGFGGSHEIKLHPWFKGFQWSKLNSREIVPPFIPNLQEDNFDQRQIIAEDEENADLIAQNIMLLRDNSIQELFFGYEFTGSVQKSSTTDSGSSSVKHSRTISSQGNLKLYDN